VLKFDRSSVKQAIQNIQNDCHQWHSHSSRVHQIRFRPGTPLGELTALPTSLAGLRGPFVYGEGKYVYYKHTSSFAAE